MIASQTQNGTTDTWAPGPHRAAALTRYTQGSTSYTNHYGDGSNSPAWTHQRRRLDPQRDWLQRSPRRRGHGIGHHPRSCPTSTEMCWRPPALAPLHDGAGQYLHLHRIRRSRKRFGPGSYGWLGGNQISSNALGGQLLMGARAYNTNSGRFSQPDPVRRRIGQFLRLRLQNPVTNTDLTGMYACQGVGSSTWFRTCWMYLNESMVKKLEIGMGVSAGTLGLFCVAENPTSPRLLGLGSRDPPGQSLHLDGQWPRRLAVPRRVEVCFGYFRGWTWTGASMGVLGQQMVLLVARLQPA